MIGETAAIIIGLIGPVMVGCLFIYFSFFTPEQRRERKERAKIKLQAKLESDAQRIAEKRIRDAYVEDRANEIVRERLGQRDGEER